MVNDVLTNRFEDLGSKRRSFECSEQTKTRFSGSHDSLSSNSGLHNTGGLTRKDIHPVLCKAEDPRINLPTLEDLLPVADDVGRDLLRYFRRFPHIHQRPAKTGNAEAERGELLRGINRADGQIQHLECKSGHLLGGYVAGEGYFRGSAVRPGSVSTNIAFSMA